MTKYNWRLTKEQKDEAVKLYEQGLSIQGIADMYGVSRQGMWDVLKRRTKMRSNLRYGKENHFWRHGWKRNRHDKVHNIFEEALEKGQLKRKRKCEICDEDGNFADGRAGVHAHHPDYNKPLEVIWLCYKCHYDWHKENEAVPLRQS